MVTLLFQVLTYLPTFSAVLANIGTFYSNFKLPGTEHPYWMWTWAVHEVFLPGNVRNANSQVLILTQTNWIVLRKCCCMLLNHCLNGAVSRQGDSKELSEGNLLWISCHLFWSPVPSTSNPSRADVNSRRKMAILLMLCASQHYQSQRSHTELTVVCEVKLSGFKYWLHYPPSISHLILVSSICKMTANNVITSGGHSDD